jgi:APA family basic amino acid/polyamine antiporter
LAIAALSLWTCVLILLGDLSPVPNKRLFDVLTDYCVFGGSLFYLGSVVAVFVLRRTRPHAERPYRTWGYPVVPAVFVLFYVFLLALMLASAVWECLLGLTLIAVGIAVYGAAHRLSGQTD